MLGGNSTNSTDRYVFSNNKFVVWDYVVFALLLAISSVIGLYYGCTGKKQSSTSEFLMAGRSMGILPVALSLLASFMSAITLLGTPAEIAIFGTHYWMIALSYFFVIPASAYIFVPIFYSLNLTSVFEYLEKRFSRGVRTYGCITYIVQTEMYLALVLYAPCLALSVVTGLNKWIAVCSVGVVCTFYTTIGGMKAVMWTDVVQIILMFFGMIGVIIQGTIDFGGFGNIWRINAEHQRVFFWDPDPNPLVRHTFWSLVIGGTFTWLAIYGVNQAQVQRALCTPTCRQAQIAMWINLPGLVALLTICSLCGMAVFAEFFECNPLKRNFDKDQLLPLYVMEKMNYPGFPGFFTACIFCGALSTISSGLNSLAAVFLQDLLLNYHFKDLPDKRAALASKLLSLSFGAVMILLTFVASLLGGVLEATMTIFGVIGGPILGLFILGIFYPWANYKGAYFALTVGLCMSLWLGIGAQVYKPPKLGIIPPPMTTDACPMNSTELVMNEIKVNPLISFYQISYMWYSVFAVMVTTMSGFIFSLITVLLLNLQNGEELFPKPLLETNVDHFITGPNDLTMIDETLFNPLVVKLVKLVSKKQDATADASDTGFSYSNEGFCHDDESNSSISIEITKF